MPFLRVLRDKRGYETTYLVHWFRDGNRQRSRILYVFRTPPGVRVGGRPFEPAVVREIEAAYPEIQFDWKTLVQNQQVVAPATERRPRKRRRGEETEETGTAAAGAETQALEEGRARSPEVETPQGAAPAPPRFTVPSAIEGTTPDERIAWLRSWYPQIRDRIPHRTHDPVRREALFALAERLNPEPWVGEDGIAGGLRNAAEALLRLSRVFSKRRRRPRRGSRPGAGPETATGGS